MRTSMVEMQRLCIHIIQNGNNSQSSISITNKSDSMKYIISTNTVWPDEINLNSTTMYLSNHRVLSQQDEL